jgi:type IV pilus assembly protein PilB
MENRDKKMMLGQVLVREGLVTEKQLQRALAEQARRDSYLPLGEMCVHAKFLSKADLQKVLRKHRSHIYIGDLLVNLGLLNQEDLLQVLEFQQIDGKRLGRLLIEHGLITEANLLNALSMQLGIPKLTPSPGIVQPSVLKGVSKAFLVKHSCLPVYQDGESVTVIMSDPLSEETLQSLEQIFRCRIEPAVASTEEIQKGIRMIFDDLKLTDRPAETKIIKQEQRRLVIDETTAAARSDDNTVEVTNFIITEAVNDGATDIHIEAALRRKRSGSCSSSPAPSPVVLSPPTAPRCSRFTSTRTPCSTTSWSGTPSSRATKPTPQLLRCVCPSIRLRSRPAFREPSIVPILAEVRV